MPTDVVTMDKIVSLSKRRGFVFQSSEIYGGISSSYDYGHYGVLLKNNVKGQWWRAMLQERDDIVALDSAIIQHPRTWLASGHLAGFTDPLVDCRTCKLRFRADKLDDAACGRKPSKHPGETPDCDLTEARDFNLMFETTVGPGQGGGLDRLPAPRDRSGHLPELQELPAVLPQEAAVRDRSDRQELPQRDHARELHLPHAGVRADGDGVLRPASRGAAVVRALARAASGLVPAARDPRRTTYGCAPMTQTSCRTTPARTSDVEYLFPIGWQELEGIANRGNFDLTQHAEYSGQKLEYVDTASGERYVPHVIEPAAGADRACSRSWSTPTTRTRSRARHGPCCGCIRCWRRSRWRCCRWCARTASPSSPAESTQELRERVQAEYDEGGAIGRRYRRQDEIGTPWAVTIDHQSLEDRTVTLRDRDSLAQDRIPSPSSATRSSGGCARRGHPRRPERSAAPRS